MEKNIIIFGASGHAKVVIDIIEGQGLYKIAGIADKAVNGNSKLLGYRVFSEEELAAEINKNNVFGGIVAVGDNYIRSKIVEKIASQFPDFNFINAIHPSCHISRHSTIGSGNVFMAGSIVNAGTKIFDHNIINTNSSIDHDCAVGSYSTIAPSVSLGGGVTLKPFSSILIGAVVKHNVTIGKNSVIGAGSVVLHDVPENSLAYGVPAKIIRTRIDGERYL
ncbi:MAG TPA: transferase [Alphaproteobacteria bacterium]|nr:transferase [Alphaproteobacteria bacterium]